MSREDRNAVFCLLRLPSHAQGIEEHQEPGLTHSNAAGGEELGVRVSQSQILKVHKKLPTTQDKTMPSLPLNFFLPLLVLALTT